MYYVFPLSSIGSGIEQPSNKCFCYMLKKGRLGWEDTVAPLNIWSVSWKGGITLWLKVYLRIHIKTSNIKTSLMCLFRDKRH